MNDTITARSEQLPEGAVESDFLRLTATGSMDSADNTGDSVLAVQEKVNEFRVLVAPVERAIRELQLARGMLRARAEDEINALSPALSALSETLNISTLELLTAGDRSQFLQDAVQRAGLPVDEVRRRIGAAGGDSPFGFGLISDEA